MELKKLSTVASATPKPPLTRHPRRLEADGAEPDLPIADIEAAIRTTRYGVVQIIIQDGVVVQIDRTEKLRLR